MGSSRQRQVGTALKSILESHFIHKAGTIGVLSALWFFLNSWLWMEFPCLCCCWHGGLLCVLVSARLSKTPAMSVCPHCLWCELSTWICQAAPWVALLPCEFAKLSWKLNTICISSEFLLLGTSGQVGEVLKTAFLWAFWHFQPPPVNRTKTDEEFIARSVWELLLRSWFPNSSKVGFKSCLNVHINQMLVAH